MTAEWFWGRVGTNIVCTWVGNILIYFTRGHKDIADIMWSFR